MNHPQLKSKLEVFAEQYSLELNPNLKEAYDRNAIRFIKDEVPTEIGRLFYLRLYDGLKDKKKYKETKVEDEEW